MKVVVILSCLACISALRRRIKTDELSSRKWADSEGFADAFVSDETFARLEAENPDWDEPFSLNELDHSKEVDDISKPYHYNNSLLSRKSLRDNIKFANNPRVLYMTNIDFMGGKHSSWEKQTLNLQAQIARLPQSGAVLFVGDDPFASNCRSVECNKPELLDDPRILAVVAENPTCSHPKVTPMPIGIESGLLGGVRGNPTKDLFMNLMEHPIPTNQRKYNVQDDSHLHKFASPNSGMGNDRGEMQNQVQRSAIDDWYGHHIDINSHFRNHVAQAKLSLCPEGNGQDTHRFYHNYALRTRCIVKKGLLSKVHSQFPGTIVVDSWSEVTAENISKWIEEGPAPYDPKLISSKYWINKFLKPHGISPLV